MKKEYEQIGYNFAKGFFHWIGIIVIGGVFLLTAYTLTIKSIDDSDVSRWKRSGMRVYTDNLTGIQYLSVPGGGITPRMGIDGKFIVVK